MIEEVVPDEMSSNARTSYHTIHIMRQVIPDGYVSNEENKPHTAGTLSLNQNNTTGDIILSVQTPK